MIKSRAGINKRPRRKDWPIKMDTAEEVRRQILSGIQTDGDRKEMRSFIEIDVCVCVVWQNWKELKRNTTQNPSKYITSYHYERTSKRKMTMKT